MNPRPNALPESLAERLNARDRILAEAHLARAEALIDLLFAAGSGLRRLGAALARPWTAGFEAETRERTRYWPHPLLAASAGALIDRRDRPPRAAG